MDSDFTSTFPAMNQFRGLLHRGLVRVGLKVCSCFGRYCDVTSVNGVVATPFSTGDRYEGRGTPLNQVVEGVLALHGQVGIHAAELEQRPVAREVRLLRRRAESGVRFWEGGYHESRGS